MLLLADFCYNLVNESDDGLVHFVSLVDSFDHGSLRNLISTCFDHDHFLSGRSNGQVQIALLPLLLAGIDDELAIDHAYLGHSAGTIKRNIRNAGSDSSTDHCYQLGTTLGIYAHYHVVQGYVVTVILGEQGTHRSVDDTAGQNSVLACLALSLIEAAGDLTHSVHFLFVLYTQREEIDTVSGLLGSGCGTENSGITIVHECTSVCLLTYTVDINHQRSACKIHLVTLIHKFLLSIVRDFIFCVPHGTLLSLYDINNLINISTVWRITETTEKFMLFLPTYPFQRSRGSLPYRLLPKSNDRVSVITYTEKAERRCNRQTPLTSQHYFLKPSFSINARYLSISFFFR